MSKSKSVKERAIWLQFRDAFIAEQEKLICKYCNKELVSDAPINPRSPKHHVFKRVKGLPKDSIATVDHVIPVSKGGPQFDKNNLVVACTKCNGAKADKTLEEWKGKSDGKSSDP